MLLFHVHFSFFFTLVRNTKTQATEHENLRQKEGKTMNQAI